SILLNVPGDAGAIMTALDGHPMARQGQAGVALSISAWSSFVGSVIAIAGIVAFAPLLARWALAFGPAEYFALMCFAFACITGLMGTAPLKAALAALLGLALSTVGLDSNSGVYRFTGDDVHLSDGIQFIVVVIGVFSVSEVLLMLEQHHGTGGLVRLTGRSLFNVRELLHTAPSTLRSSVVGFVVGVLPGAGATIASAMTYAMEKRIAGADGRFGEGDIRGVAAPEAANNASAAGSFVPMLTLGVPGSGTTAVMMGALALYNITPGPALFSQNADLVWGLIASLFIGNLMLLAINIPMVGAFTSLLRVPNWLLVPGILAVSAVGVFSVHATTFDLLLMVVLGLVAYLLRKQGVPMAPLILGFVLGDLMEQNLRRALSISNGELGVLVSSPITRALWFAALVMLVLPPLLRWRGRRRQRARSAPA
ncbi:MAG: tripartite tricarboxylate transporter permease, partial [Burkholderiales bacterium]|nr:tripartite tricarboxylate transporter permease [Burkholderiales bacterium]